MPSAIREPVGTPSSTPPPDWLGIEAFLRAVNWLDGSPMLPHVEPYRLSILKTVLDSHLNGRLRYNLALAGRGKKNYKSCDLVLAMLFGLLGNESVRGNQCFLVANDEGQALDDLTLAKKLVAASPSLKTRLTILNNRIVRKDGKGEITVLASGDVSGSHGKSYRMVGFDEIHGFRDYNLLEALQLDPHRDDAQMLITSYASLHHRPGIPLHDLMKMGKAGTDPRMFFSWYSGSFTTDPALQAPEISAEARANPSIANFPPDYLAQQRLRLPSFKFRRLHLNEPGLPEGSAFQLEMINEAIARGIYVRKPEPNITYHAFVDPSGGSHDSMTCGIAHQDEDGRAVLDRVMDQGEAPPFNPSNAVVRFAKVLKEYGISTVVGDKYGGTTFAFKFEECGIRYQVSTMTASEMYAALEPKLNGKELVLLDNAQLEQELLGLVWRGSKIDHLPSEKDDLANSAVGACLLALDPVADEDLEILTEYDKQLMGQHLRHMGGDPAILDDQYVADDTGAAYEGRDMRMSRLNSDGTRTYMW